ncbi:CoA-binding protein [Anaerotalea alkaliphila]|uniref:CoA-binding protein n=1 Tax=Anaerotalea alkaliphila TaxID=2662126 RepID=A0A7X5HVS9_9FIRM|nr:CoA-binding protein [Anaerotalea alkaliphila]NDL67361.1 CoA-binding protein [Anaerotalea alkaliphila]
MQHKEMLALKHWAVVGASNKKGGYGSKAYKILKYSGHTVYPVTPNYEEVDGDKAYARVGDIPGPVDAVDMVVSPEIALGVLEECAAAGIKNIWLQPGSRSPEILEAAKGHGMNVVESCVIKELTGEEE